MVSEKTSRPLAEAKESLWPDVFSLTLAEGSNNPFIYSLRPNGEPLIDIKFKNFINLMAISAWRLALHSLGPKAVDERIGPRLETTSLMGLWPAWRPTRDNNSQK
jgi:hypothetical protein